MRIFNYFIKDSEIKGIGPLLYEQRTLMNKERRYYCTLIMTYQSVEVTTSWMEVEDPTFDPNEERCLAEHAHIIKKLQQLFGEAVKGVLAKKTPPKKVIKKARQ